MHIRYTIRCYPTIQIDTVFCSIMKYALATFFLTVFSFQILPVSELGKLLFDQQMMEEVSDVALELDDSPENEIKKDRCVFYKEFEEEAFLAYQIQQQQSFNNISENNIRKQYTPDIITPPPNSVII